MLNSAFRIQHSEFVLIPPSRYTPRTDLDRKNLMSVKVRIPSPLRNYTNGADIVEAEGATIADVLNGLKEKAAGIETRLFKGDRKSVV